MTDSSTDATQRFANHSIRFRPPRVSNTQLHRNELLDRLNAAAPLAMTTILAGAGYGKTTLLAQFVEQREKEDLSIAWISLSEADEDTLHFLRSVLFSVNQIDSSLSIVARSILRSNDPKTFDAVVGSLLDEISQSSLTISLVLDDYYLAECAENNRILDLIAQNSPRNFGIVLSSRWEPDLELAGLRLRGQLAEFDSSDLRLDQTESATLLSSSIDVDIDSDQTQEIINYIDGWAMGIQVAAISIRQSGTAEKFTRRVTEGGPGVSEYLVNHILADLETDLISFLRETAHLDILIPELCNSCTGRTDSAARLHELDRLNLFVQQVDQSEQWFRYHHLFRDFLRRHFGAEYRRDLRDRHERAFRWFEQQELPAYAIEHALKAELWDDAKNSIEKIWKQWLSSSRFVQLQQWITTLPERVVDGSPTLRIAMIWADGLQRRLGVAKADLQALLTKLDVSVEFLAGTITSDDPLHIDLLILKCAIDNMLDDNEEIVKLASLEPENFEHLDPFSRGLLLNYITYARVLAGNFDQAARFAETAVKYQIESDDALVAVHSLIFSGLGRRISGDLNGAKRAFERATNLSREHFGFPYSSTQSLLATVSYETGDLEAAARLLNAADTATITPATIDPLIAQYITQAKLLCRNDQDGSALDLLTQAEILGREEGGTRLLIAALVERAKILLRQGSIADAKEIERELLSISERKRTLKHFSWPMSQSLVAQASALIAIYENNFEEARKTISPYAVEAEASGRVHPLIIFLSIETLSYAREGREKLASRRLSKAMALGEKGRYIQTFSDTLRDHLDVVQISLNRCALDGVDKSYLQSLSAAFKISLADWAMDDTEKGASIDFELTAREHDLLVALNAGLTNKQIAHDVSISQNTVAWHLKNLFAKLEVNTRTAAVNVARKQGLLR